MEKKGYIKGVGSGFDGFMTACDAIGMSEIPIVSQGADLISGVGYSGSVKLYERYTYS